jgi:hypothetical protein
MELEMTEPFRNPYRPGAGHMPPYLAGRTTEQREFEKLLEQTTITENMILTGLRGVGKTVLLDTLKPRALEAKWGWVGTDLSETASISEANLALRILTDLAVATSDLAVLSDRGLKVGFAASNEASETVYLDYGRLCSIYDSAPGLPADKLKSVLEIAHNELARAGRDRLVFAYDEAQNLADHAKKDQFPLSVLLDVFQSIQRKGIPFVLLLTGLPTLFPKLVESRTFSERMFRVVTLERLDREASKEAIKRPLTDNACPVQLNDESVELITNQSGGYPYFIQFICREVYDVFVQQVARDGRASAVPMEPIQRKLDSDFFSGRWARVTDRQRELLRVIAELPNSDAEFTIQDIVQRARDLPSKSFSPSHVNQMLASLGEHGLIYKNRLGKYSFAVPLLADFITRLYPDPALSTNLD